jgi:hypothetical protein
VLFWKEGYLIYGDKNLIIWEKKSVPVILKNIKVGLSYRISEGGGVIISERR